MTPIDADFIFIQLTGSKFRNDCNSKSFPWNRRVVSPTLKRPSHLGKCSGTQKVVDSKLEFATFLKALEMIAQKMYPEIDVQSSIKIIIEKVCKLRDSKHVEQRTIGFHQITHLKDFQQDESQVNFLKIRIKKIDENPCYSSQKHWSLLQVLRRLSSQDKLDRIYQISYGL